MSDERRVGTTREAPGTVGEAPPQVLMPLLDYITAHSLDEDYAHVAERSTHEGEPTRPPVRPGLAALVVMGLFGLLVATAAVQTARKADEVSSSKESIITQIDARRAQVGARRDRVASLREEVAALQTDFLDATAQGRALTNRLDRLEVVTGATPVTGTGVKVVVDDAPNAVEDRQRVLDEDLQKLANALWASGAEAISINGQRLNNLNAIRTAGDAITVNLVSLSPPYRVLAVGDPDTMPARFVETKHGQDWLDLQSFWHLQLDMTSERSMRLPATPTRRLTLRHATLMETP